MLVRGQGNATLPKSALSDHMAESEIRERIVELLGDHPEGMTILGIAQALELNRNTVTKYIYELSGAGILVQRRVGSAKLCFIPNPHTAKDAIRSMKTLAGM